MVSPSNSIRQSVGVKGVTTSSPHPQQQLWVAVAYSMRHVEDSRRTTLQTNSCAIFEALHDISGERSSTVVFPLPIELLGLLNKAPGDAK